MVKAFLFATVVFISHPALVALEKPNIVVILADDLGYGELGCQGNQQIPTPNIDSISKNGIRFTQGYVTAPFCSASRAGLLTGRYQMRFGYEFNPIGAMNEDPNEGLPLDEKTIADFLVNAGYVNGLFGKWHLGGTARFNPIRRGFDEFFGFMHEGHYFVPPPYKDTTTWMRRKVLPGGGDGRWTSHDGKTIYSTHMKGTEPDYDADNPIYRGGQPVEENEYLTDAFTREAVDFVDRNHDRPFFLMVSYNAVHSPIQALDSDLKKFEHIDDIQRRIFAAMLSNLDDGVGKVLEAIREKKLEEKTLIFFLSDNGGPTRELTSSNAPLRDGKGSVYEGGIRVPFLAQWKGKLPAAKSYEHPVSSLDIFGTAMAISGGKSTPGKTYDGVNLMPYLTAKNESRPHEELFWRVGKKTALRLGDWKLVKNPKHFPRNLKRKTLPPVYGWELYNLKEDSVEANNLAKAMPNKLAELMSRWESINSEMIDPVSKR